ncbi:uncharacterized protein LOC121372670 [Gigantopelta aegis]|uniref:uncharacterized protein LOC121372670 n=1 Tax=Gigantopelta aegis TaxID=1735272 RepID=UPI001B88E488|nr:uncharacterized protein LOC121372670 [Gigantopelta aegis]XP_041355051.1 uncharacterized protein LOC121372670 [Gigantopelta aegis]
MTSDMSMTERLMRHKNRILQRQVDVKLKIMENEHKAAQKEILESQRDCSVFLANLSNTWVGLNEYDQPDTRAMAKDPRLRCRRVSVMPVDVMDNDHSSNNAEEQNVCHRQKRSYSPQSEYCFPEKRAEMTCITVLDDILQAYGKGRRKQERHRKIGILIVPNPADMNSNRTMYNIAEGVCQTSGSSKDNRRSRPVSGVSQGIRRVSLVPDTLLLRSRNRSSSLAYGDGVSNRNIQDVPVIRNIILPPRPQTVSQERFTHSIPPNKGISKRPQTAVTIRRSSIFGQVASDLPWQTRRPTIADPYALLPGEEYGRKRPKTALTKYELYGRSPAVGRTTVAGIMAEMQNRRSETRRLLEHSRQLKNKVKKLIRPERQYDPEETEEQC